MTAAPRIVESTGPQLARCPKCKQALSGLVVVGGVLKTAVGGTEIGAAKCGRCDYMIHWGKKKS